MFHLVLYILEWIVHHCQLSWCLKQGNLYFEAFHGAVREELLLDIVMRESLESILAGSMSEWSWWKASLPSSQSGINLHSASIYAPAAFLVSSSLSLPLVEMMLCCPLRSFHHTSSTKALLSIAAACPNGQCLDDVDVPSHQGLVSIPINDDLHNYLLSSAPSNCTRALVFFLRFAS